MLAGVKALRSASTRRVAGFGLDPGSAQATSSTYRRLSECLGLIHSSSSRRPTDGHREDIEMDTTATNTRSPT